MANFVVSYDLHNERHYEPVWEALLKLTATKLLDSLWLVSYQGTAAKLAEEVKAAADNDDSVAVIQIAPSGDWATIRADKDGVAWLRENVKA